MKSIVIGEHTLGVVLCERTLGESPHVSKALMVQILRASNLRGSPYSHLEGWIYLPVQSNIQSENYRLATEADFEAFRVLWNPYYTDETIPQCQLVVPPIKDIS